MWSFCDNIFHSVRPIPSLKLFGSKAGIDTKASMSPFVDVHRDQGARLVAHPPRRILLQPLVDRQLDGLPLRSGLGSSSLTSLPRAVTSTRCPPGVPRR